MKFELLKILEKIKELYNLPRSRQRFEKYLLMLQGETKDEMILPIAAFNPMGKELAAEKLNRLIELNAEEIAQQEIEKINLAISAPHHRTVQVALNLVDDVDGSWSNYYTTNYESKFKIGPLVKRDFCTPVFWTREEVTKETIAQRVREYLFRTIYWITHGQPESLRDALEQEIYVQTKASDDISLPESKDFSNIAQFFTEYAASEDYNLKFNFFYGDEASRSLGYAAYGILPDEGFEYARFIAASRSR